MKSVRLLTGKGTMSELDQNEFRFWARYIYEISGISLESSKSYLIESRLTPLLKEYGCMSFRDLYKKSRQDATGDIEKKIVDQITTNETFFFRDNHPFEMLKYKIIPDIIDRKIQQTSSGYPSSIRIWSAGCSTGQEVYSIAISLKEILNDFINCNISVLGTDISGAAISKASSGTYNQFEMERGLLPDALKKYFFQERDNWKIQDEIRGKVTFKKANLFKPFSELGKFDVIFCRNVAVYFNVDDRKKLFHNIEKALAKEGVLIIGSTESLNGVAPQFEPRRYLKSVYYQLKK